MLRKTFCLALFALAPALAAQAVPKVGERLPPVTLEGLSQSAAAAFADYYGQAVLLEFFAHWCVPCVASVPHLNELQQEYGARGFAVVAVTSEDPRKTEPWVQKHGVKYAYGYDDGGALHRAFRVDRIPFAVLVDPFGTVVWTGNPQFLGKEVLERALPGALTNPVWAWGAEGRPLARLLQKEEYAAALRQAEAASTEGGALLALVRERIEAARAQFERMLAREDYRDAFQFAQRLQAGLAGSPEGVAVAERVAALRADPEVTHRTKAQERLAELEARAVAVTAVTQAEELRPDVTAFLEEIERQPAGQKVERRARALLEAIDRAIQKKRERPGKKQQ